MFYDSGKILRYVLIFGEVEANVSFVIRRVC